MGGCQSGHFSSYFCQEIQWVAGWGGGGENMTDVGWQGHKDVINALVLYRQMNEKRKKMVRHI